MQNITKTQKYLICAFVLFFPIKIKAQNSIMVKRKFNIEFSLYGFGSKNTVDNTQGDELAKSFIEFNTGNIVRFGYDFNQNHAIGIGLNYYRKNISIDYTLEKQKYNLPYPIDGPNTYILHIIGVPVSYQYSVLITKKLKLSMQSGYIISIPIMGEVHSGVSYMENNQKKDILGIKYTNPKKINNLFFEFGFRKALKKNELKISLLSQIPLKNLVFANYTFFEQIPDKTSKGIVKSGLGYVGLNISYILTHKKRK